MVACPFPLAPSSSERLDDVRHVVAIRRGDAEGDAKIGKRFVRVVAAMHLPDRLRIDVAGFRADEYALLEMRLEYPLQSQKECRAVVAMEIGPAVRRKLGRIYLHLRLGVFRDRGIELVEQHVAMQLLAGGTRP